MEIVEEIRTEYEIERNKPMPSTVHSALQPNISFELMLQYRNQFRILTEVNIEISDSYAVPDVAIYPPMEIDLQHDIIRRTDAPLVTIEILSPTQALQDLVDKTALYFGFGVKSCWIILPSIKAVLAYYQIGKYDFFKENDKLMDRNLSIELSLENIFK